MRLFVFLITLTMSISPSFGQDFLNDVQIKEFEIPGIPLMPGATSTHVFAVREVGDLNGDGQTELIGRSRYGSMVTVNLEDAFNMGIASIGETLEAPVLFSMLDGNFSAESSEPAWLSVHPAPPKGWCNMYSSGADINSDGWLELVIGSAPADEDGEEQNGRVLLLSGADGSLLRTLTGDHPDFGALATGLGDITGDGLPEVVVNTISGLALYPTTLEDSVVTQPIWSIEIEGASWIYNPGDRDGDGVADLCVLTKIKGEDGGDEERVWTTYSGATGEPLALEEACLHAQVNLSNGMRMSPQPVDLVTIYSPVLKFSEH
ncbi:MAG: VCBS repeat-containing protein [Bdellovibrionales bacterium]|nr:VCBS repeat-containing protein [Bdellovibrionales bacterium]